MWDVCFALNTICNGITVDGCAGAATNSSLNSDRIPDQCHRSLWSAIQKRQCLWLQWNLSKFTNSIVVPFLFFQVLSALDILQPPSLDFFQEMYPFSFHSILRNGVCHWVVPGPLLTDSCGIGWRSDGRVCLTESGIPSQQGECNCNWVSPCGGCSVSRKGSLSQSKYLFKHFMRKSMDMLCFRCKALFYHDPDWQKHILRAPHG